MALFTSFPSFSANLLPVVWNAHDGDHHFPLLVNTSSRSQWNAAQACLSQLVLSVATLLRWWTWSGLLMTNVHHVRTKQRGGLKSSLSQSRNSTISQSLCVGAPCCSKQQSAAKVKLFQQRFLWPQW